MTANSTRPSSRTDRSGFMNADRDQVDLYGRLFTYPWIRDLPLEDKTPRLALGVVLDEHGNSGAAFRAAWRADSEKMLDRAAKVPHEFLAFIRSSMTKSPPEAAYASALANDNEQMACQAARPGFRGELRSVFEAFVTYSEEEDARVAPSRL